MGLAKKLEMRPSTVTLPPIKKGSVMPSPTMANKSKSRSNKKK